MSKFTGTIRKNDLEGGFWELVDRDTRYQLDGGDSKLRVDGQRVEIEGSVQTATMGIGMVGSVLKVSGWRSLD